MDKLSFEDACQIVFQHEAIERHNAIFSLHFQRIAPNEQTMKIMRTQTPQHYQSNVNRSTKTEMISTVIIIVSVRT